MDDFQRSALESILASAPRPETMRLAVATASRTAANRPGVTDVSETCVAAHLLPDGSGEVQVFGNLATEFVPTMISHGSNIGAHVPTVAVQAAVTGPTRLVGATWTPNGPLSAMVLAVRELWRQTGDGWPALS